MGNSKMANKKLKFEMEKLNKEITKKMINTDDIIKRTSVIWDTLVDKTNKKDVKFYKNFNKKWLKDDATNLLIYLNKY